MLTGRPGPVHVEVAMDAQADPVDSPVPEVGGRWVTGRVHPDRADVEKAAALLWGARRPVIVAGGGTISAEATRALVALAEHLGAPVVTTFNGKGAIPEDHELNGWYVGSMGSTCGNKLTTSADVLLSVGCRFVDWTAGSWRKGESYSIPPTKLIQIDIDPTEIGKNYPAEVPLVADARAALADLLAAVEQRGPGRAYRDGAYFGEIRGLQDEWAEVQSRLRCSSSLPMTQQRAAVELRKVLDRRTIITAGAGIPQMVAHQDFPVYEPRTHLSSGGFSTMGFTVPGAIGAQLAQPDRPVVAFAGDGDFLQTMQEIAVAAMLDLPVLFVVLNNCGWISIRNGQDGLFGRNTMTEFRKKDGSWYTPDFAKVAKNFGLHGERVEDPAQVGPAAKRALATRGPALLEIMVARTGPEASYTIPGWWDLPVPAYREEQRAAYEEARRGLQVL
jgi:acetolactate synthase-1/2/3 large subunit